MDRREPPAPAPVHRNGGPALLISIPQGSSSIAQPRRGEGCLASPIERASASRSSGGKGKSAGRPRGTTRRSPTAILGRGRVDPARRAEAGTGRTTRSAATGISTARGHTRFGAVPGVRGAWQPNKMGPRLAPGGGFRIRRSTPQIHRRHPASRTEGGPQRVSRLRHLSAGDVARALTSLSQGPPPIQTPP